MICIRLLSTTIALLATMSIVNAQQQGAPIADPLFQQPVQQPGAPQQPNFAPTVPPTSGRPVSAAAIKPLGLVQKAWDNPLANKGPRQTRPGFLKVRWRPDEVIQLNIREGMLSVIKFPSNEEIITYTVSDPGSFEASVNPNHRSVIVRALYAGVDGNIILVGSSGNVYNFYVRSLPFNAPSIPDTTVQVVVVGMLDTTGETEASQTPMSDPYDNYKSLMTPQAKSENDAFKKGSREFGRVTPVKAENMANNIEIKIRDTRDSAIAPIRAWHDDHFTYLDFGPRASSMTQWPVASLVIQGIESPVGTRVSGRDRSMMIVEAVGDIVLRDGALQVCLKVETPNNDARYSIPPVNKDPLKTLVVNKHESVKTAAAAPVAAPVPAPATTPAPPVPVPPKQAKRGGLAIVYPPMTVENGLNTWNAIKKDHPAAAPKLRAEWIDAHGQTASAPAENETASIRIYGFDRKTAAHICNTAAVCTIVN